MNKLAFELSLIVLFGVLFFMIDINTFDYSDKSVYPLLLTHHIINVFSQFGFLCNDKYLLIAYIFAPIIVIGHWLTNNNKCVLTEMVNDKCGIDSGTNFRDMWFLMGIKKLKYYDQLHYSYLIVGWIIAVIKLRRMKVF